MNQHDNLRLLLTEEERTLIKMWTDPAFVKKHPRNKSLLTDIDYIAKFFKQDATRLRVIANGLKQRLLDKVDEI